MVKKICKVPSASRASYQLTPVKPHEESGEWSCEFDSEARVLAHYRPGLATLGDHIDDWKDVHGFDFSLLPALDPDAEKTYSGGKMTLKALHDGKDMYFLLQVKGDYVYSKRWLVRRHAAAADF